MSIARRLGNSCLVATFALAAFSLWADEIDRYSSKTPLRGSITAESSKELTIKVTQAGKTEEVKVTLGDVAEVKYDGAAGLAIRTAAGMERAGQYVKAIESYQKAAAAANDTGFVAQASQFGQARSLAKIALQDRTRLDEAIKSLEDFRGKHADSRFHYVLHDLLGQLQMEKGNDAAAAQAFGELASAPIGDVKLKASVWQGRLLMKAGKFAEAQGKFEEVIAANVKTPAEKLRQQEALLAIGDCLVKQKKLDEAEQMFRKVIDEASPEESELQAATCNALGDVLREAGKTKEALLAYLEVDLLYSTQKAAHARAIYYSSILWDQVGRGDNATESREKLKRLYPESSWAKQPAKP
jgi:tetratricopeptide (TPR) repeat protein